MALGSTIEGTAYILCLNIAVASAHTKHLIGKFQDPQTLIVCLQFKYTHLLPWYSFAAIEETLNSSVT